MCRPSSSLAADCVESEQPAPKADTGHREGRVGIWRSQAPQQDGVHIRAAIRAVPLQVLHVSLDACLSCVGCNGELAAGRCNLVVI
jgi:hypothetical protein